MFLCRSSPAAQGGDHLMFRSLQRWLLEELVDAPLQDLLSFWGVSAVGLRCFLVEGDPA